jgi:mono/diheme cytochrome c family protein
MGLAVALAAISQPSAAQTAAVSAPAAPAADAAKLAKGKDVFTNYGCGSCHTLAAAGASGNVGPSFDHDANLSHDFVVDRVTNGQGPMPSFGGQMSADDIDAVATYVVQSAQK